MFVAPSVLRSLEVSGSSYISQIALLMLLGWFAWQADDPALNFKGHYDEEYRRRHPKAPLVVPWISGVTSQ